MKQSGNSQPTRLGVVTPYEGMRATFAMVVVFYRVNPVRMVTVLSMVFIAGLLEGFSLLSFLPVLAVVTGEAGGEVSSLNNAILEAVEVLGFGSSLATLLSLMVFAVTCKAILTYWALRLSAAAAVDYAAELRRGMIQALMRADWQFYTKQSSGRLSNAITQEASQASSSYSAFVTLAAGVFQLAILFLLTLITSWEATLLAALGGGVMFVCLRTFVGIARRAGKAQVEVMNTLMQQLVEGLQLVKPLKAMAREDRLQPVLEDETRELNLAQKKLVNASLAMSVYQEPIVAAFLGVFLLVGLSGAGFPVSTLAFLAVLFHRIMTRVGHVQVLYQKMASYEAAFWSLHKIAHKAECAAEPEQTRGRQPVFQTGLEIKNISFVYENAPVLNDISVTIPARGITIIYGPSGSGKSTLADLIIGLLQPKDGQILLDGQPLQNYSQVAWRRSIGYVPQEPLLFADTIRNNVTLRDESIDDVTVMHALERAQAASFVATQPMGLDARVGERGGQLSGGERQRLTLARALVRNPRLLILDEPTASLDPAAENEICQVLKEVGTETAIFAITHREKMLDIGQQVLIMDAGRLSPVQSNVPSEIELRTAK